MVIERVNVIIKETSHNQNRPLIISACSTKGAIWKCAPMHASVSVKMFFEISKHSSVSLGERSQ